MTTHDLSETGPQLTAFSARLGFSLDPFQHRACLALESGQGVLVCAPTGAGKTIVGEFAVHLALAHGTKCFYTTPIKALSNQKFHDLVDVHGAENVGLLTGDNSINSGAPVVVMTTEVLRNMLYADSSALRGLSHVVMDEVHFLADRFRGAVWEEVILGLDPAVRVVSLSATVSNAEEFGDWITTVRGDTAVIVDEHRPVPLHQHMLVANRMFGLFDRKHPGQVNPELNRYIKHRLLSDDAVGGYRERLARERRRGGTGISRPRLIRLLEENGLLPAITFIFSRKGCDGALAQCLRSDLNLLEPHQVQAVDAIVDRHLEALAPGDADVLGVDEWREGLRRGFAAHHAGLLPTFRQAVEELFVEGLVQVVFATETLALGINMPARSVVLERLVKYNGEAHVDLTPGEYTQLTGRAGRRGIDVEGHAVVVWTPEVVPDRLAGLAGARTFPLRSSFAPEYNMAMNLIDRLGVEGSRDLLRRSFAQFQTDRSVVGQARQLDRARLTLRKVDGELEHSTERHGLAPEAFLEYVSLREDIRRQERAAKFVRRMEASDAVSEDLLALKPGHVIGLNTGRHRGLAVVLEPAAIDRDPKPLVLCEDGWVGRVGVRDFVNPPEVLGNLRIPKSANRRSAHGRRDLVAMLRSSGIDRPRGRNTKRKKQSESDLRLVELRNRLKKHPVHKLGGIDDLHRLAERRHRLLRDIDGLERAVDERTAALETEFDAITGVLTELSYLETDDAGELAVTPTGAVLRRIYSESDLLVAECIRAGIWDRLSPPDLAAVVSAMVYESRRDSYTGGIDSMPGNKALRDALVATVEVWHATNEVQERHGVVQTREPDTGFCVAIGAWASGRSLREALLAASERGQMLSPGDFVRWNRQVIDLLEQVRGSVEPESSLAEAARKAVKGVRRGVVASELD
ncbi:DEAD/DEAH box helicase [Gordonia neofelifaecis]|uniref:DEAD/DEAH box helicase domain-containing protein n=1 Tax=Gordonia neofelifaecis NRRL B-59395 TaxID=644548 RepID=F1YGQ3_9ACTN|nr:DEAD/DEAH box helicase [Gordonia neofelifaecis]EGD56201.1 DEAD/DEAH box helicase domain-containing protein [Gordonia neofelifaecis NRRL B-59395]